MNFQEEYPAKPFERISYLFRQYEQRRTTPEEKKELFQWLEENANNELVNKFFIKGFQEEPEVIWSRKEWEPIVEQILLKLPNTTGNNPKLVRFLKMAVAAAIILFLIACTWVVFYSDNYPPKMAGKSFRPPSQNDALPETDNAVLTLADGSQIMLDSVTNGQFSVQGNAQVTKLANGQLAYSLKGNTLPNNTAITYNTLKTPKGGQYQIVLADGTKVWLNAASSISYPTAFTGTSRKVSITGEAYFEVTPSSSLNAGIPKPFLVSAKGTTVEVLGTQFNINAYEDEPFVKTSLLEGSVKIANYLLKPGQAYENGRITTTNITQDIAWKNGIFNFNDKNLDQIMRQLSRWYNLDVVYPQGVPKIEFGGELKRNLNLSQILKILEKSGVQFQLEGRHLIVKP